MEKNTKIELAKAIIEKLIGRERANNASLEDPELQQLLEMRTQVYHFNEEVMDDVLQKYHNAIVGGGQD